MRLPASGLASEPGRRRAPPECVPAWSGSASWPGAASWRPRRVGVEGLLQELDQGGAGGALDDVVQAAPSGQLDGAEDGALLVLARLGCDTAPSIQPASVLP